MVKAKKWAVCIGYCGRNYFGMQRQTWLVIFICLNLNLIMIYLFIIFSNNKILEDIPTIEDQLLKAFYKSGLITENEYLSPNIMHFQRAARTDKGVSAIRQIISMNSNLDMQSYLPKINELMPDHIRVFSAKRTTKYFDCKNFCDGRTYSYLMPSYTICPLTDIATESYKISPDIIKEFNSILKLYVGTHNFHNFTSQKKPTDPSARRYITECECSPPFILSNNERKLEFIVTRIKGQSFMLHQIRKMIGLAIAIIKGFTNVDVITRAFGLDQIDVPIAPGLGLLLEDVHYEKYNRKYGGDGIHEPILWDEFNDSIAKFKDTHIYPNIVETELNESNMLKWLATLPIHTYDTREHTPNRPALLDAAKILKTDENDRTSIDETINENDQPTINQDDNKDEPPSKKVKMEQN